MAKLEKFTQQEIPYGILGKFGLTQEMIDDLPGNVMNRLLMGRKTPILPVCMKTADGKEVETYARVSLVRLDNGKVDAFFAAQWTGEDLSQFTPEQQQTLIEGNVTTAMVAGKGRCYVQLDGITNQVMTVPVGIINQNLSVLVQDLGMDEDGKKILGKGGVIQTDTKGVTVSAGVDLNETEGVRLATGDIISWQEDAKADRLQKYNFGLYGCWMANEDNVLSYVPEKDFDEDLLAEYDRSVAATAAKERVNQIKMN